MHSPAAPSPVPAIAVTSQPPVPVLGRKMRWFHGLFGVLLPVVTFFFEALVGLCAETGFDPLATWWHVGLVLSVPAVNAWLLFLIGARQFDEIGAPWADRAGAWVAGIAAGYVICFLPMMPFALIAVVFLGAGLLPLAPMFGLICALLLRRSWRRRMRAAGKTVVGGHAQILVGLGVTALLFVPPVITDWAVKQSAARDEAPLALAWLRGAASEDQLLTKAHGDLRSGFWDWIHTPASAEDYQLAYYRATGRAARSLPPVGRVGIWRGDRRERWAGWDATLGEQKVGAIVPHLDFIESKLEGTADAATATGYTEWTLVFQNRHEFQQAEARALIQLPAGGVVSRLTLWIDGEEREAAFGGRSQVTQAYQAVVHQRRDPVLVTDQGADRVLMQCFPVQPKRGEMKVRLGVTYPLALTPDGGGRVVWPRIIAQNFQTKENLRHVVWCVASGEIRGHAAALVREPANSQTVRGQLSSASLAAGAGNFVVACPLDAVAESVVPDDSVRRVRQVIQMEPGAGDELAIVLDGSAPMAATGEALAAALARWPMNRRVTLCFSGDHVRRAPHETAREVAAWLRQQEFVGGQDNSAALLAAYQAVAGRQGATILWIHGGQPNTWKDLSAVTQRFARDRGAVSLWDYSPGWEDNPRLAELAAAAKLRRVDPAGNGVDEMTRVLRAVVEPAPVTQREVFAKVNEPLKIEVSENEGARQIARLWAREEVDRLMHGFRPRLAEAVKLGRAAQVVTAVTSAVVLETKAQYDAAGLTPVDPDSTPSIPEPATAALVGGALALVFAWRWRRRKGGQFDPAQKTSQRSVSESVALPPNPKA